MSSSNSKQHLINVKTLLEVTSYWYENICTGSLKYRSSAVDYFAAKNKLHIKVPVNEVVRPSQFDRVYCILRVMLLINSKLMFDYASPNKEMFLGPLARGFSRGPILGWHWNTLIYYKLSTS